MRFLRSLRCLNYSSTPSLASNNASYLGDALSKKIETVPLTYDIHLPPNTESEVHLKDKSPLIFLHGLFGSKSNNRTVAKQLSERLTRPVYCLDLRNFGSSPHVPRLDYPSLAADVEKFITDQKFTQKPILIGHSMGAKTAMAIALRCPEVPSMVISVDNAPVSGNISGGSVFSRYIRQLRIALEQLKLTNIKEVDAKLAEVEPNKSTRQFLLTNLSRNKPDEPVTSKIPLELIGKSIDAGNIASWPYDFNITRWSKGPTLFIRGTESSYVPDETIVDIGNFFPNFEVRDVKAGHWLIAEKPQEFVNIVEEFIIRKEEDEEGDIIF